MKSLNRSFNYLLTLSSGIVAFLFGIVGAGKTLYWCYEVSSGSKDFSLSSFIALVLVSLFILFTGLTLIKVSQRL